MPPTPLIQCNPYKGVNPRCWVRLRFAAADGSLHERELLADTGCPCAVILGQADLTILLRAPGAAINSNFGQLTGAWLELHMPELGLTHQLAAYGSDAVLQAARVESPDFAGLAGLPLLRMMEYGGDGGSFWLCKLAAGP
ncbi:MAG: hypothetical protein L0Y71_20695 [Gemmataceae bacterium]|nr:hypothetical protein [Gemmataceae bacterium]